MAAATRTLVVLWFLLAAGCPSRPTGPVEIKGRLLDAEGEPLAGVGLRFHLEGGGAGAALICLTQKNGDFVGRCQPGTYAVTALPPPKDAPKGAPELPAAYRSAAETPWKVTVPGGGVKDIVLRVE